MMLMQNGTITSTNENSPNSDKGRLRTNSSDVRKCAPEARRDNPNSPPSAIAPQKTRRDRDGRVVTFPFQNGQVVLMAPELAGLDFRGRIHTLDTATREVQGGPGILPGVLARLPGWAWAQPLARTPWLARLGMNWFSR